MIRHCGGGLHLRFRHPPVRVTAGVHLLIDKIRPGQNLPTAAHPSLPCNVITPSDVPTSLLMWLDRGVPVN